MTGSDDSKDALVVLLLSIIRKQQGALASIVDAVQESNECTAERMARIGYPVEEEE